MAGGHSIDGAATLFEQPDVAAVARQHLAGTPTGEQVKIVEGDFFKDPIPEGHDAVIVANVVHLFSPEQSFPKYF